MATGHEGGLVQNMSWSSDEMQIGLSNSLFRKIPNEIIIKIFRHLSVPDLCNVSLVCRSFKTIADLDEIWKPKLLELEARHASRTACAICAPPAYPRRAENEHRFVSIGGFDKHPNSTQEM